MTFKSLDQRGSWLRTGFGFKLLWGRLPGMWILNLSRESTGRTIFNRLFLIRR